MQNTFKGTRDIYGKEIQIMQSVLDVVRGVFESYGFEPLETPVIERMDVLMGKYGEEAENLLFSLAEPHENGGLRYDHTVPLARFAARHWQDLPTPYRRYAIGPVFRAENTQKGRHRQFIQCDFDTLGTESRLVDAEIAAINYSILSELGFTDEFMIYFNDRELLSALAEELGLGGQEEVVFRGWDKLDKMSVEKVIDYISNEGGVEKEKKDRLLEVTEKLVATDEYEKLLSWMRGEFRSRKAQEGLQEIVNLRTAMLDLGVSENHISFNPLLARGLSYYTGPIFETVVEKAGVGSITGGGRYDRLIGEMGGPDVPASGSSFGLDRLISVMSELGLAPEGTQPTTVLVTIFDKKYLSDSARIASEMREAGVSVELYPEDDARLDRQLKYADKRGIPFVVIAGESEISEKKVTLKDMQSGEQRELALSELINTVSS